MYASSVALMYCGSDPLPTTRLVALTNGLPAVRIDDESESTETVAPRPFAAKVRPHAHPRRPPPHIVETPCIRESKP